MYKFMYMYKIIKWKNNKKTYLVGVYFHVSVQLLCAVSVLRPSSSGKGEPLDCILSL